MEQAKAGRRWLETLARELNHPAADLLNWYAADLPLFATIPEEQRRYIVGEYLENLETYRGPHHLEAQQAPALPSQAEAVPCCDCRHWTPDPINPAGGAGLCGAGAGGSAYPWKGCPKGRREVA
jgi:hypothetical protein